MEDIYKALMNLQDDQNFDDLTVNSLNVTGTTETNDLIANGNTTLTDVDANKIELKQESGGTTIIYMDATDGNGLIVTDSLTVNNDISAYDLEITNSLQAKNAGGSTFLVIDKTYENMGIGTSGAAEFALLQLDSTTKGFLKPRLSTSNINDITLTSIYDGLEVYNTTIKKTCFYNGSKWVIPGHFRFTLGTDQDTQGTIIWETYEANTEAAFSYSSETGGITLKQIGTYRIHCSASIKNEDSGTAERAVVLKLMTGITDLFKAYDSVSYHDSGNTFSNVTICSLYTTTLENTIVRFYYESLDGGNAVVDAASHGYIEYIG